MRKFLRDWSLALGLAALLSFGGSHDAQAEIAGATFTAVDAVSGTVCTTAENH